MLVTIYQPQYFPRLHYFNRILSSDIFVILDSAQYTKNLVHHNGKERKRHTSYQADTPIMWIQGEYQLTVPVKHNGLLAINQTEIDYSSKWPYKHIGTLKSAYGKAPQFDRLFPFVEKILKQQYRSLAELNIKTMLFGIAKLMGVEEDSSTLTIEEINKQLAKDKKIRLKKIMTGSELGVERPEGSQKGTEWTGAICKKLGATEYYHGGTAQAGYMELDYYKNLGITPIVQNWKCNDYLQQFSDKVNFLTNLSILDLLFNTDQKTSRAILGIT